MNMDNIRIKISFLFFLNIFKKIKTFINKGNIKNKIKIKDERYSFFIKIKEINNIKSNPITDKKLYKIKLNTLLRLKLFLSIFLFYFY
jgi:hypothetical protein